jgi:hypothetical protein
MRAFPNALFSFASCSYAITVLEMLPMNLTRINFIIIVGFAMKVPTLKEEANMRKIIALPLLLIFLTSFSLAQNWFEGSLDDAIAKSKSEGKLVLIDFFSGG